MNKELVNNAIKELKDVINESVDDGCEDMAIWAVHKIIEIRNAVATIMWCESPVYPAFPSKDDGVLRCKSQLIKG